MTTLAQRVFELPWFVALYDRLRESPAAWLACGMTFEREVDWYAHALERAPGRTFVEVACGQGSFGVGVLRRLPGSRVIALDRSTAQLRRAGEKAAARGADGYTRVRGDALRLPFPDETFDGALCVGGLHQIPSPERAVAEMARVVRSGGVLVGAPLVLPPGLSRPVGMNASTVDDVEGWLRDAGLSDLVSHRARVWCMFQAVK